MELYWIILLVFLREVYCAEVCTSQVAGATLTVTCTGNKHCCENDTNCCSKLSTVAIIAFAVGGAVVLALIVGLIIYAIVKQKKKSNVTPVQPAGSSVHDQPPPYTPHLLENHRPPGAPPGYDAHASGSTFPSTGNAPTQQSERKIPL